MLIHIIIRLMIFIAMLLMTFHFILYLPFLIKQKAPKL
nr:MAG TPA: hypothetical protein [Caudoviricetes sp.]